MSPLRLPDEGPPDEELSDVRYAVVRLPDEGPPYRLSGEELPYWLCCVRLPDEELSAMRRAEFAALALSTALLREPYLLPRGACASAASFIIFAVTVVSAVNSHDILSIYMYPQDAGSYLK